jgi:hypothetical protein
MKKWFIIAVCLGGLYYYATHTEGGSEQFAQFSAWFEQWTGQKVTNLNVGDNKTTVYKIQNPDGTWTYSNEKPKAADGVVEHSVITQEYRTDSNVLPSLSNTESNAKE